MKKKTTTEGAMERFANNAARYLFTNAVKQRADTLRLFTKSDNYLGGWCEESVAYELLRRLEQYERQKAKR